jgi:ferredoxin
MKRTVIKIDEEKCNGCGRCVIGCHEGALQLIEGKAKIISELYCDGLGACIGECPVGAIILEERETEAYDEIAVMQRIVLQGEETVLAHLKHLKAHQQTDFFQQGVNFLRENHIAFDFSKLHDIRGHFSGCPGNKERFFEQKQNNIDPSQCVEIKDSTTQKIEILSEQRNFPLQLHLINPNASFLQDADLLLAADCSAFCFGNFHQQFIKNHILTIACPKLDTNQEIYLKKLKIMLEESKIRSLTVVIMEVPCCGGLLGLAEKALSSSYRNIPLQKVVISVRGEILEIK